MKTIIFFALLVLTCAVTVSNAAAQGSTCNSSIITDENSRSYTENKLFKFDVDGDGKADTITPRTYKVKGTRKYSKKVHEIHWITFDLRTSKGTVIKSFFKYEYGTNLADYWGYSVTPCKINKGTKFDLLFYTGDDTSDETVVLKNRGTAFKVHSRKVNEH